MKIIKEMIIVFSISLVGVFLSQFIPLPASIIALMILLLLLLFKVIKPEQIKSISHFLLTYMPLLFIPMTAKIIEDYPLITNQIIAFLLICIISTVITFFVSGMATKLLMKWLVKNNERDYE